MEAHGVPKLGARTEAQLEGSGAGSAGKHRRDVALVLWCFALGAVIDRLKLDRERGSKKNPVVKKGAQSENKGAERAQKGAQKII